VLSLVAEDMVKKGGPNQGYSAYFECYLGA
jgi:hypothetical protein